MNDGTPTLEVGFAIDTGGSFNELERLQAVMNSSEATALKAAAAVERQFNGLNLGGANGQIQGFGNVVTREMARAEKAGEGLIRQLQRQAEQYGKTGAEIRNMRVDKLTADLERLGNTDAASRLRALNTEMGRLETSAVRATGSTGGARAAMQGLSFQAQDAFTQISMGTNVLSVLAIQGGQAAGQMANMGGRLGAVASFLVGPWGLAITGAMLILGSLTKGLFDGAGAADEKAKAAKDLTVAIDQLAQSTSRATETEWDAQRATLASAQALRQKALDARADTIETLSNTRAKLAAAIADSARADPSRGQDGGIDFATVRAAGLEKQLAGLDKKLADQQAQLTKTTVTFRNAQISYIGSGVAASLDQATGLTRNYQQQLSLLNQQFRATGDVAAYQRARTALETTYAAEQKSLTATGKARTQADRTARAAATAAEREAKATAREYAEIEKAANDYADAQNKMTAQVGKSAKELRLFQDAAARAKAPTDALKKAIDDAAAARETALTKQAGDNFQANVIAPLERELALYGLVGPARAAAALALEKEGFIAKATADGLDDVERRWREYYAAKSLLIGKDAAAEREAADIKAVNDELAYLADSADVIARSVQAGARGMADAFGEVGRAIGDMASIYADFRAEQASADEAHLKALASAETPAAKERENAKFALANFNKQIAMYGDMTTAAQGFFKKGSAGYQALGAAEKVFRAVQFAMSVRSMVQDASETISSVLNSTARAAAHGAEGVAVQSKLTFPYNIVAMAATAAALVAAGIAVLGGGGGSSGPSVPTAGDHQNQQGTGTVLGDASAKSESINKSLELMMRNSSKDLEYSNEMVRSLRAIESNIGNLAAAVARETKVGGGLDASSLGLGTNTGGGLFGVGGLFSKTITRELNDSGLQFDATSVASVIAGGITANLYQEILKTTKKSGFLGIGGSTRTTVETVSTAADSGLTTEVSLLINNMRTAIVTAAGTIGIDGAAAMLDAFQINIGRISFKDLTSEEIENELAAVFSRVGDDMAGAVAGGIAEFQQAGEGMLETLVRLAKEYQTVDVTLHSIGMTFGAVGLASVGARDALIDLFGGLDDFTEQTGFFRENFLSEAEQMAPVIAAVQAEMARLGQAGVDTKDEFKSLVLGLDLSTESGRETYAALMAVAPAFAKTADYLGSLNGELQSTAKTAEQLASIAKQRRALDIQLMEATGDATGALAAKRADELTGLDETLRALQQQVWTAQDAAQAARDLAAAQAEADKAASALATQRRGLEIELMDATGDAAGALAARRADEIAALDATLRPLREQILAAQDAAAAQAALSAAEAEAAEAATALAQTRRGMEIELMEALGDASGALAARRADELAATDASLRALRQQIYAAQDAAAANAALAQAQQAAADAAAQAAEKMAQIAQQRSTLQIALLRANGNDTAAVAAERALQLATTDETLRGLQEQVWAAEDARAAAEAAAAAQAAYAQEQQRLAQEAEQLRKQRSGMEAQLLDLVGNAAGATALRRQEELAALDASLRPLQQSIYAQEDLAAAATAAADRVSTARDTLTEAYKRESDALGSTIERFNGFGESLRKFRGELGNSGDATIDAYRAAQARFVDASALAARGDEGALGELEAISKDFLAASKDRAGSLLEYQRDVARVAGSVDRAIGATDEAVDYAQAQLDALNTSVAGLIDINKSVVSVHDAIVALQVAIAGSAPAAVPAAPATANGAAAQPVQLDSAALERRIDDLSARLEVQNTAVAENTGKMSRLMDRWDGGGLLVRTDDDTPLSVTSVDA